MFLKLQCDILDYSLKYKFYRQLTCFMFIILVKDFLVIANLLRVFLISKIISTLPQYLIDLVTDNQENDKQQ